MWKPCSLLCKRFNVAEPFGGTMVEEKPQKKSGFSIFDYLEGSVNRKDNFVTPVIIPTKAEKPKPIIQQTTEKVNVSSSSAQRLSTKELFAKEIEKPKENAITETITSSSGDSIKESTESRATAFSSASKDPAKKPAKPKSDLEKKIEESKNKHPSEKKDLFKAIFDSSSEDEVEDEKQNDDKTASTTPNVNIIESLKKPASELNVLRNTSPPRGIFAYLFKESSNKGKEEVENVTQDEKKEEPVLAKKIIFNAKRESSHKKPENNVIKPPPPPPPPSVEEETEENIYGPKIPTRTIPVISEKQSDEAHASSSNGKEDPMDRKLLKLLKKSKKKTEIVEEWVEKSEINHKDSKKKKKSKDKDRDKKKKSKKHKKDKKKRK